MIDPSIVFAQAYDKEFQNATRGYSHKEIPLFQAMHSTLVKLGERFDVEEYHGTAHQVTFTGDGVCARPLARCELSDLLIVSFSAMSRSVRMTFLQAKSERRAILSPICGETYSANLEQWFLLKNRPKITGVGTFNPPEDLLESALLPSVGSFAFFYKDKDDAFQTYYASANHLTPSKAYTQRYGRLQGDCQYYKSTSGFCSKSSGACTSAKSLFGRYIENSSGHIECLAACGNRAFAESLFRLEIGTPIDPSVCDTASTRKWLCSNVKALIKKASRSPNKSSRLAQELLAALVSGEDGYPADHTGKQEIFNRSALGENGELGGAFGARKLIIIKSSIDPNDSFVSDTSQATYRWGIEGTLRL